MPFHIVPAVHVTNRSFPDGPGEGTPTAQATALAREYGGVYVTDVEGVRRNSPDVEFLRDLCRGRPVWLDTGPRDAADAMDSLMAAPDKLVVRWTAVRRASDLEELTEIADPGMVHVMLEFEESGAFVRNPREAHLDLEAVRKLLDAHGTAMVVNAPAYDGALAQRLAPAEPVEEGAPWWYGPIRRDEATALRRAHFAGAIVPVPLAPEAAEGARDEEVKPE